MALKRFLDDHRDELGAPLSIHRAGLTLRLLLAVAAPWVVGVALFLVLPWFDLWTALAFAVVTGVILVWLVVFSALEPLFVCERGLMLGMRQHPGAPRFVVRYEQIVPGSLVPVTRAQNYRALTKPPGASQTLRVLTGTTQGLHFVGPEAEEATRPRTARPALRSTAMRAVDGRTVWFASTGRTPPSTVAAEIAQAARRQGLTHLADATEAAPTRALTRSPADRHRLLPGLPPVAPPWQ